MKDLLFLVLAILAFLFSVAMGAELLGRLKCEEAAEISQADEHKYSHMSGCWLMHNDKWRHLDAVRGGRVVK